MPPDTIGYNDQEFQDSDGPRFHGAPTAWVAGTTGAGEIIAIVDSGIFTANSEFAGRISADSHDIFPARATVEAEGDHGTLVAMVAAGANNGDGTVGIAYGATIMAIRSDQPDSCTGVDGCSFGDVSDAIDWAVDHGATVINMSIGGATATANEIAAVQAAANAGVVVVISAGNGGGNRPDLFPRSLAALDLGNVIIVGSVNAAGNVSSFSDKARDSEEYYLSALGQGVAVYLDGPQWASDPDCPSPTFCLISGTSFSAPQVAGAVALIAQAFPTMTGQEIVSLLFETAQDVGDPGLDDIYGWGILDIHEAFQPQGTTTLASTGTSALPLSDNTVLGSPAMGDALSAMSLETVVLDKYDRAFRHNLGFGMRGASVPPRLFGAVGQQVRSVGLDSGKTALAFTLDRSEKTLPRRLPQELSLGLADAEKARVLAARIAMRIAPRAQFGFAYAESADGLVAQLQGQDRPAFLIAREPGGNDGTLQQEDFSVAFRRTFGRLGLTAFGESGAAVTIPQTELAAELDNFRERNSVQALGFALDRRFGALATSLGLSWMDERRTVLGARLHDAFGRGGAQTIFADASASWHFAERWRFGGSLRKGWTYAGNGSLIGSGSTLASDAWSIDLERRGLFSDADRIGFRIAQPLRVASGGLKLNLPVAWSYDTESASFATRLLSLSPEGREILGELAWHSPLWGGSASASLFYRRDPGHYARIPDDSGLALRWAAEF